LRLRRLFKKKKNCQKRIVRKRSWKHVIGQCRQTRKTWRDTKQPAVKSEQRKKTHHGWNQLIHLENKDNNLGIIRAWIRLQIKIMSWFDKKVISAVAKMRPFSTRFAFYMRLTCVSDNAGRSTVWHDALRFATVKLMHISPKKLSKAEIC